MQKKKYILSLLVLIVSFSAFSEEALEINSQGNIQILKDLTVQQKVVVKESIKNSTTGTTYDPLPIGTILMFDGTNWENDKTIPGWYMCDGTNDTPNLIDKFIRGSNKAGKTDGSDNVTLIEDNLPSHSHTATSTSTNTVTNNYSAKAAKAVTATTSIQSNGHAHGFSYDRMPEHENKVKDSTGQGSTHVLDNNKNVSTGGTTGDISANHTHSVSITVPAYDPKVDIKVSTSTTTTIGDTGKNKSFSVVPAYYTVIYIKKTK